MKLTAEDRAAVSAIRSYSAAPETAIDAAYLAGLRAGLERAAKLLHMTRAEAQLMAGEMTAQEWRTLSAVLVNRAAAIRALEKN